jgi:hypothetical protein
VALRWPASPLSYRLEATTSLADSNSWSIITNEVQHVGLNEVITNQVSGRRYYRLRWP